MVLYKCDRCNKIFKQKIGYTRHTKRKYPCVNISNPSDSLSNEKNIIQELSEKINNFISNNDTSNIADPRDMIIMEMAEKLNVLNQSNKIDCGNTNCNNTVNNINNSIINHGTINNNTQIINILPYGEEDISFLTNAVYKKILKSGFSSIKDFIEEVHFNENRPENHNLYIPAEKRQLVAIYNGKNWVKCDKGEFLDQIVDDKYAILEDKYNELNEDNKLEHPIVAKFERVIDGIDEKSKRKYVKKGVALALYNNRYVVLDTIKKNETAKRIK